MNKEVERSPTSEYDCWRGKLFSGSENDNTVQGQDWKY